MKWRFLNGVCLVFLLSQLAAFVHAQAWITFDNRNIHKHDFSLYHAGIFRDDGIWGNTSTNGVGAGFTAGLFLRGLETPLATTTFHTNIGTEFFAKRQVVRVPGVREGERANLFVLVWETARGSFEACAQYGGEVGQENFTTEPLSESYPLGMYPFQGFEMDRYLTPLGHANWGFELSAYPNGTMRFGGPLHPWGFYPGIQEVGLINPTGTDHFVSGVDEGTTAAVIKMDSGSTGEAGLHRAHSSVFHQGRRYTALIAVGNLASGTSNLGFLNFAGFPGYRIDLLAGSTVLASDNNTLAIPEGEFRTSKTVFTSAEINAAFGQSIRIRLVNLNQPGTAEAPGVAVAFDNVRIFDEPLQPTILTRRIDPTSIEISWTDASDTFIGETSTDPATISWQTLDGVLADANGNHRITVTAVTATAFYRLRAL